VTLRGAACAVCQGLEVPRRGSPQAIANSAGAYIPHTTYEVCPAMNCNDAQCILTWMKVGFGISVSGGAGYVKAEGLPGDMR
jgi:hypothetical protein